MGALKGMCIGWGRLTLNHLFFVDDCILFGTVLNSRAEGLLDVISTYEQASRQRVNFDKFLLYFSTNVIEVDRSHVASIFGIHIASSPKTYLRLSMMVGYNKNRAFQHYLDRLRERLDSWSLRLLSMGSKEVCIKAVLRAISVYVIHCFLFPIRLYRAMEGLLNSFW